MGTGPLKDPTQAVKGLYGRKDAEMTLELNALTSAGQELIRTAECLSDDFASRAERHDRERSFPVENFEALQRTGYFAAPIPSVCGGMGVDSIHDVLLASTRLARGDASTTIGLNMHLNVAMILARSWSRAIATGRPHEAASTRQSMEAIGSGEMVVATLATEPGREIPAPRTTAVPSGDGWLLNGIKTFATMSPLATHFLVTAMVVRQDGQPRLSFARVPAGQPGVTVHDDWDALGMRASGSGSVSFRNVSLPEENLAGDFPYGSWSTSLLERYLIPGLTHATPSLGIAEAASTYAVDAARGRSTTQLAGQQLPALVQHLVAENEIELVAMRGTFARSAAALDQYFEAHLPGTDATVLDAFNEVQCAKTFLNSAAIRVVDRSLTMSGGAGYLSENPLSRLHRDVRAGPFMAPLGSTAAVEFIGRTALGMAP